MDRRKDVRYQVDLRCRLSIAGHWHTAHVVDLSEHGACVRDGPAVPVGTCGSLAIDSVDFALAFSMREVEGSVFHLEFAFDEATDARYRTMLERLVARRAA